MFEIYFDLSDSTGRIMLLRSIWLFLSAICPDDNEKEWLRINSALLFWQMYEGWKIIKLRNSCLAHSYCQAFSFNWILQNLFLLSQSTRVVTIHWGFFLVFSSKLNSVSIKLDLKNSKWPERLIGRSSFKYWNFEFS